MYFFKIFNELFKRNINTDINAKLIFQTDKFEM